MLNEKIRELFIKLITFAATGVLAAGLIIFAAKTLYPEDDTTKEETSSVNMAENEKAPPVEVKGSISDSASKKEAAELLESHFMELRKVQNAKEIYQQISLF